MKTPFRVLRPWVSSYADGLLLYDAYNSRPLLKFVLKSMFFVKGKRDTIINYYRGTKQLLLSGTARPALGHSHAFTMLLHKHTMAHRTVEEKDEHRVSSTALGKRKSTGDGATSRPTPARTPGRVNQAGVNEVPRSTGTSQEPQPKSSRRQVLQRTLVVLQRCALLWARQVSKITTIKFGWSRRKLFFGRTLQPSTEK